MMRKHQHHKMLTSKELNISPIKSPSSLVVKLRETEWGKTKFSRFFRSHKKHKAKSSSQSELDL